MPVTVDEQQAEHIREVHRSLAQIRNALIACRAQVDAITCEVQRLCGNAPVPVESDYE